MCSNLSIFHQGNFHTEMISTQPARFSPVFCQHKTVPVIKYRKSLYYIFLVEDM